MRYIHVIKTDGTVEKREALTKPTLKEMQEIVGGYIEPVRIKHEGRIRTMVVNDEGLILKLPANQKASVIARRVIVGNVLILEDCRL